MALMFIAVYKCEVFASLHRWDVEWEVQFSFTHVTFHHHLLVKVCILELYRNLPFLWNPSPVDLWYDYDIWNLILVQIRFCVKSDDMTLLCWQAHQEYSEQRVNVFVCDVTAEDLSAFIAPSSVDVVTLVGVPGDKTSCFFCFCGHIVDWRG
jgi:hypothetical protein